MEKATGRLCKVVSGAPMILTGYGKSKAKRNEVKTSGVGATSLKLARVLGKPSKGRRIT